MFNQIFNKKVSLVRKATGVHLVTFRTQKLSP